jgi:hypothetical protein
MNPDLIPLDDRFALDSKRQCLIARTSGGEVVFGVWPDSGLTVNSYLTVLNVRGVDYNAGGGYQGERFYVNNIRPVDWLGRKPATKAACTAVTALVDEARQEAQRRGHVSTLERHAAL